MERWVLERHREVVVAAEARARLTGVRPAGGLGVWTAARLRSLADRLDGERSRAGGPGFVSHRQS